MDITNGLHNRLADVPELAELAASHGRKLFDVRHTSVTFDVATGKKRTGKRLLTVGTDCSVGKMYASFWPVERLTNPNATCIGISLNTAALDEAEALELLAETEARTGLPCVDAVRTGVARLVDCLPT